jgi:galactokinase
MLDSRLRKAHLRSRFRDLFGVAGEAQMAAAPGRVNLIGEHTDYNEGWVLPMAIDRHIWVAFAPRSDARLRVHSVAFVDTQEVTLEDLEGARGPGWFAYIAGVVWAARQEGYDLAGADMVIDGDLPPGSGLSSSAALEMATLRALCKVSEIPWSPREMARIGQRAENDFVGVSSGLMDQLASAVALPGCALLLDCRNLDTQDIPLPEQTAVVVMDTGAPRTLAKSAYNERRQSCDRAVEILGTEDPEIRSLRDVDRETLEAARSHLDETTYRRALHVIEENLRPAALAAALQTGDLETAGRLMDDSHASLRDLYEVSSHELNLITDLAREHPACYGARLTGAGFGGSAIALVEAASAEDFSLEVHSAYHSRVDLPSQFFVCQAAGGARLLDPVTME